jgi:hypothetical protein
MLFPIMLFAGEPVSNSAKSAQLAISVTVIHGNSTDQSYVSYSKMECKIVDNIEYCTPIDTQSDSTLENDSICSESEENITCWY